jgi:hypothetical protein
LRVYLLSRDLFSLKYEVQSGNGKVSFDKYILYIFSFVCIKLCLLFDDYFLLVLVFVQIKVDGLDSYPPVELEVGKHFFLNVGEFYLSKA